MKKPWYELGINSHRTTAIMYAPNYIKPEIDSLPTNLMDIMPTMASYSGQEMINYTLGRNLNDSISKNRVVFYNRTSGGSYISIFNGRFILKHNLITDEYSLFDLNSKTPLKEIFEENKKNKSIIEIKELLDANFQSTKYLMFNNKKQ